MRRRLFLSGLTGLTAAMVMSRTGIAVNAKADIDMLQRNWRELLAEGLDVPTLDTPLNKTLADWRSQLDPKAFHVLFEEGTEHPFTSPLNEEKRAGVFACAACGLPLFSSAMKYDSGTGWPSFFTSIPDHLGTKTDFKLVWPRTEYHCARCGGHQGHVFDDGPAPTGQRWCNNGVALQFLVTDRTA
jgi:peptide-methionine (R)-S-oxide reductase